MTEEELRDMLIEYMGKGFLENILALMRQDRRTVRFIPALLSDENLMVRLGATALVEDLAREGVEELRQAVPGLVELLAHENPTIRGDSANALGLIGDPSATSALEEVRNDPNASVREVAGEALREIRDRR